MEQVIKKQVRKLTLNDDIVVGVNPTTVEVVPSLSSGIEIAKIFVNGEKSTIYGTKGGGITDVLVDGTTIKKTVDEGRLYVGSIPKSKITDLNIPTKTSELQNDSGFITGSSISSHLSSLETKVNHKIFLNNPDENLNNYVEELSVIKISSDEYFKMIAEDVELSSNILYVVESDYLNAAGRQLCNLTMNDDEDPNVSYEGMAVTDTFIKKLSNDIFAALKQLSIDIISSLSNQ